MRKFLHLRWLIGNQECLFDSIAREDVSLNPIGEFIQSSFRVIQAGSYLAWHKGARTS